MKIKKEELQAIYSALDNIIQLRDETTSEFVVELSDVGATGLYDARETVYELLGGDL
jgi:hypothetical protein